MKYSLISSLSLLCILMFLSLSSSQTLASSSLQKASTASLLCGNGVVDYGEECDGDNLARQTCMSRGLAGGRLRCDSECFLDISGCFVDTPLSTSTDIIQLGSWELGWRDIIISLATALFLTLVGLGYVLYRVAILSGLLPARLFLIAPLWDNHLGSLKRDIEYYLNYLDSKSSMTPPEQSLYDSFQKALKDYEEYRHQK